MSDYEQSQVTHTFIFNNEEERDLFNRWFSRGRCRGDANLRKFCEDEGEEFPPIVTYNKVKNETSFVRRAGDE